MGLSLTPRTHLPWPAVRLACLPRSNPYSWSTNATVVFIETPACVGFSYADDIAGCTADDFSAAQQSLTALLDFFGTGKFPEYAGNDLYLAGESYAGAFSAGGCAGVHPRGVRLAVESGQSVGGGRAAPG